MHEREHAYRVMAIIERHRTELGGTATDGGPGCAPVHATARRSDAGPGRSTEHGRVALAPAGAR
jgi:hypothetical protein